MNKKLLSICVLSVIGAASAADITKGKAVMKHSQQEQLFCKGKQLPQQRSVRDLMNDQRFLQTHAIKNGEINLSLLGLTSLDGLNEYPGIEQATHLNLSGNHIESIASEDFENMRALLSLNMSRNMIGELPAGSFSHLRSLRDVLLSGNRIRNIHDDAFLGCNFCNIDLSHNRLTSFDPDLISNMTDLYFLILSNNRLSERARVYLIWSYYDDDVYISL